ncbi:hypothetical protein ACFT5B_08305 [Luteimicrobium sp. NPDC057192]|uniref:hypothetical protein n=1 Tax=Luteimicrobium sp. NPDC057192 TaxID=3346042 RepID=UPI00363FE686
MSSPRHPSVASLVAEAEAPGTTTARLAELARHPSAMVRQTVAEHPALDDATVLLLARDAKELVRGTAASNAWRRPGVEAKLAASEHRWVRAVLAHTYARDPGRSLRRETQHVLAHDSFREVRVRTAETTSWRDLFDLLLADAEPFVRSACAGNPRATRDDVERLLGDRSATVRTAAADRAPNLRFPDREQTIRAARDRSRFVRSVALDRGVAWPEVTRLLVDDPDELVRRAAREVVEGGPDVAARVERFRRAEGLRPAQPTFDG